MFIKKIKYTIENHYKNVPTITTKTKGGRLAQLDACPPKELNV
jgi:hypothetical protein